MIPDTTDYALPPQVAYLFTMKATYKPGDLVRVIRQPAGRIFRTMTGVYGYVLWVTPKDGTAYVCGHATKNPDRGSSDTVAFADLVPCTDKGWARFLAPLAKEGLARKSSPVVDKLMEEIGRDEYRRKEKAEDAARAKWAARNPDPFVMDRGIARNDKGNYFAYRSGVAQKAEELRRGIAGGTGRSPKEMVTLQRANAFLDQASFWPDREIIRDLARELDLDPYAGQFNDALYLESKVRAVPTSELRKTVIRLLNAGHAILDFTPVNEENCCRDDGEFWIITAGKRKRLPVA
jgi:hypothetical protein